MQITLTWQSIIIAFVVTGAVNVAALALLYACLIGSGASQKKYVAQIKKNGTAKIYVGFIKRGGQWHPCGQ